jgi:nitrous oxide reductase accessory protein NosL
MTAHYFASRKIKFVVISDTVRPIGEKIAVSGKAEARRIAAERGAKCWNF